MEVSEEQKQRMEANRAAALARRNAKLHFHVIDESSTCVRLPMQHRSWAPRLDVNLKNCNNSAILNSAPLDLQPCPEQENHHRILKSCVNMDNHVLSVLTSNSVASHVVQHGGGPSNLNAFDNQQLLKGCGTVGQAGEKVKVSLEMCAQDRFLLMVKSGFVPQGFLKYVSIASRCENLEPSAMWPVYNLKDYDKVTEALKGLLDVEYEQIPWPTRMVLEKFQRAAEAGMPVGPNHITDSEVEQVFLNLPPRLLNTLHPFQREGVKYGLQRGGRCLLADEMGVGKTVQAIAIASCYREEGSLLVICPASLRLVWAEELERWLPYLCPLDVHLVFNRKNNLTENMPLPKIVVISYNMLARLRGSMSSRKWGMIIVDEAHNLRCTSKKLECDETTAVLELVQNVKRVVLLTGTPSLSRPFDIFNQINCLWPNLLGKNKYEFARNYCDLQRQSSGQGNYKGGSRLPELNVLLKQTVMIRRLKNDVMSQLPSKRRQIICLQLAPVDIKEAKALTAATAREKISAQTGEEVCKCGFTRIRACDCEDENEDESSVECEERQNITAGSTSARSLTEQEIGVAKLRGFHEWLLNNSIFADRESQTESGHGKMIIFAHHLKVLDSVQTIVQSKGVEFVRIDGSTLPQDRFKHVNRFQSDPEVKLAIIGVQAGGVGLNFSAAQRVAFVELPKSASEMLQAEDRAHRQGQKNAVNIYIFVAKGTTDDRRWQSLSKSLERVSTMIDGAVTSLEIDCVVHPANKCLETRRPQMDGCTLRESNGSLGIGTSDQLSQDSCKASETTAKDTHAENTNCRSFILGHPANHSPACEMQQRLSTTQLKDTTHGLGDNSLDFPATSLMFEVSSNTGRIHLFVRSSDEYAGPLSLQANFKPEDLAHFTESGISERGALPSCLAHSASHREIATLFWEEYCNLRPVFRQRLRGRPLSLPLSAELESFKDKDQYIAGGILKGGSRRRWTPRDEMGFKIPAGAKWRTISYHKRNGLKETSIAQAWTAEDVPLCKYCQQPCKGQRSTKPELYEDLFCQITCLNEYSSKTSRRHIREDLFDLEGGVCVKCGLDCHALVDRIRPLPLEMRRPYIMDKAPQFTGHKLMLERLIKEPIEGNAWHADHIVAVADGGGECTMENFQTLCIACHARVTAEQHRRRRAEKLKIKVGLQRTMKKLLERSEINKRRRTSYTEGDAGVPHMDSSDSEDDQDLLDIKVAGSAYSSSVGPEVHTEHACKSTLQPLSMEGHVPTDVGGSLPQVRASTEEITEHACKPIQQPRRMEGHESTNHMRSSPSFSNLKVFESIPNLRSLPHVKASTEKLTEHACKSMQQPLRTEACHESISHVRSSPCLPTLETHESITNLRSSPQVTSSIEVISENAPKPILQPPIMEDHELTRNVRRSPYFHSLEGHTSTNILRRSSQVNDFPVSVCTKTGSGASHTPRATVLSVAVPEARRPTFSLMALNKYLIGPV